MKAIASTTTVQIYLVKLQNVACPAATIDPNFPYITIIILSIVDHLALKSRQRYIRKKKTHKS